MLQYSKLLNSRHQWRKKATKSSTEARELRKTRKRLGEKIAELKQQNHALQQLVKKNKT